MSHRDDFGPDEQSITPAAVRASFEAPARKVRFTLIAFLGIALGTAGISLVLRPAFSGFWAGISIALVGFSFATYATIQRRIPEAALFGFIGLVVAAINLPTVFQMFPLQQPVRAATFQDATIAEILHHAAMSKDDRPRWRFYVSDRNLAEKRISLTIPPQASLEDVLESLKAETGVSYRWNWFKFCGQATQPSFAHFYITDDPACRHYDGEVKIDRDGIDVLIE